MIVDIIIHSILLILLNLWGINNAIKKTIGEYTSSTGNNWEKEFSKPISPGKESNGSNIKGERFIFYVIFLPVHLL